MSSKNNNNRSEHIPEKSKGDRTLAHVSTIDFRISIAYARALFHCANQSNVIDKVVEDFESFILIWDQLEIFRRFIECYAIDRDLKREKLSYYFKEKFHPIFFTFLQVIISRGKPELFSSIYDAFVEMYDELVGRERVDIKTASPLNEKQKDHLVSVLQNILNKKYILLNPKINPDLLGGFMVRTNTIKIDTSLKNDLESIKKNILNRS